ncbi:hypothetical protein [Silvimonas iriomotensis]|uniref:Uncharacterized protein n=1 Tax=Silvimonas iriomotensis TaxID=449662 RepID=A0ABQ2PEX7_9NEIS|nr:hypothetical protein [Silvimonas iriomotensis]GGP23815.1 hypothetical protein GCM10010970_38150 [Silvimonas iriomotensis]
MPKHLFYLLYAIAIVGGGTLLDYNVSRAGSRSSGGYYGGSPGAGGWVSGGHHK